MLTTDFQAKNVKSCVVAPPSNATTQLSPKCRATGYATTAQPISLKALAGKHLRRNRPRNFDATEGEKSTQLFTEKMSEKVARVAREIDRENPPFNNPDFVRLAAAASRVGRDIHGDGDEAIADMIDDLTHSPADSWAALTDHFEHQLHAQLNAQPPCNDPGRTRAHFNNFVLTDGRRVSFDADIQTGRLDELRAAGYDIDLPAGPRPDHVVVSCCDCQHSELDGGIARCRAGVDSGLATGGYWHDDRHHCDRFTTINDEVAT